LVVGYAAGGVEGGEDRDEEAGGLQGVAKDRAGQRVVVNDGDDRGVCVHTARSPSVSLSAGAGAGLIGFERRRAGKPAVARADNAGGGKSGVRQLSNLRAVPKDNG